MARRRAVLAAAALLVLLLVAAALVSFDASTIGRAVLARAAAATGATLTARQVRLRLLTGLTLEGVEGGASFTGGRAAITLDRLVLDHSLWRLALGELAVDRIVLERPHVRLVEARPDAARPVPIPASAAALGPLSLRVSRVDVEDGTLELKAAGETKPVVMRGLVLRLREVAMPRTAGPPLATLQGTGEVQVAEIAFPRTRATEVRGAMRLGGGRLGAGPIRFRTPQGPFEATLDTRLERLPFTYTLGLRGEPLELASLLSAQPQQKGASGTASLQLDGSGVGSEAAGLTGRGVLRLSGGALPATPVLRAVEGVIGRTLVGARYEPAEAAFRIEHGRVLFDDVQLRAAPIGLDLSGWASLQGPLDLTLALHAPREGLAVPGVSPAALDLMTDDQGRLLIPLKVTGTQDAPRVRPDSAAFADAAGRSAARRLFDKAGRGLGGLFRRPPERR